MLANRRCARAVATAVAFALPLAVAVSCAIEPWPWPPPTGSPTTSTAPDPGVPPIYAAACAGQLEIVSVGAVPAAYSEISGLAASRQHPGVIWAVEDSGRPNQLIAFDTSGSPLASVTISNATNVDWEDLALAPGPDGRDWLYIADIGDNFASRSALTVYALPEPAIADGTVSATARTVTHDGGPVDAEAFSVNQAGSWLITKGWWGMADLEKLEPGSDVFRPTGAAGGPAGELHTSMSVSADGRVLAVRTYGALRLYVVPANGDLDAAIRGRACVAPTIPNEPQGESVTFLPDSSQVMTVSERAWRGTSEVHVLRERRR